MDIFITVLDEFGMWGLIVFVLIYVFLNSEFTIRYPRGARKKNNFE